MSLQNYRRSHGIRHASRRSVHFHGDDIGTGALCEAANSYRRPTCHLPSNSYRCAWLRRVGVAHNPREPSGGVAERKAFSSASGDLANVAPQTAPDCWPHKREATRRGPYRFSDGRHQDEPAVNPPAPQNKSTQNLCHQTPFTFVCRSIRRRVRPYVALAVVRRELFRHHYALDHAQLHGQSRHFASSFMLMLSAIQRSSSERQKAPCTKRTPGLSFWAER